MVTVYTKNRCVQCTQTKKELTKKGVPYTEVNIDRNDAVKEQLIKEGWAAMPVVKTKETSWSGFQPERIRNLT